MAVYGVLLLAFTALLATSAAGARSLQQTLDASVINNVLAAYQRDPQGTVNTIASRTPLYAACNAGASPGEGREPGHTLIVCIGWLPTNTSNNFESK